MSPLTHFLAHSWNRTLCATRFDVPVVGDFVEISRVHPLAMAGADGMDVDGSDEAVRRARVIRYIMSPSTSPAGSPGLTGCAVTPSPAVFWYSAFVPHRTLDTVLVESVPNTRICDAV